MSQSSKCDEHRRLHNAKSPSLIDDTVTHTHTHAGMPTLTVSHTHIHAHARSPAKKRCPGTYIHRQKSPPLVTRISSRLRIPGASRSHTPLTHTRLSLSLSLSLCAALSHIHTCTDAAALTQPAREEGSKRVRRGEKRRNDWEHNGWEREKKRWKTEGVSVENDRLGVFIQCLYFRVEASVAEGKTAMCV